MSLIKCPECGKDVSDQAKFCPNCGCPVTPPITSYQQNIQLNTPMNTPTNTKKKDSVLSILSIIFSLFGCTAIIGCILAIIDLCIHDGKRKLGSIAALIICGIWVILAILVPSGSKSQTSGTTSTKESTKQEAQVAKDDTKESDASETAEISYINVTADELADALSSNAMKAQNDYENQYLEIYGKLGTIDSDGKYIGIDTSTYSFTNIQCYIKSDEQKQIIMQLSKGDDIVVHGYCKDIGEILGYQIDIESIEPYNLDSDNDEVTSDDGLTIGQRNALASAKNYLSFTSFSYDGLIEQLEYEKFSHEDAVYAADTCGADWNEQAAEKAKAYLDMMSFSRDGLIEQLEYDGFTHDQAVYGAEQNGY